MKPILNNIKNIKKKPLSAKQMTVVYIIVLLISITLIALLTGLFISSKIKNTDLTNEYNQVQNSYEAIQKDNELKSDKNYKDADNKDSTNDSEPKIFIKEI